MNMIEQLLNLPGFVYRIGSSYYYLGKWICKECTDMDITDCVTMYEMCYDSEEKDGTLFYYNKLRAYSDFALDIPYDASKIRQDMTNLISSLSEQEIMQLQAQLKRVTT